MIAEAVAAHSTPTFWKNIGHESASRMEKLMEILFRIPTQPFTLLFYIHFMSFDPARVEAVTGCKTSLFGFRNDTISAERR